MLYIFDMGGVVTTTAHVEKGIASVLHITEDAFVQFCRGTKSGEEDLWAAYSDGRVSTAEFWRQFSARSGIAVATDWCQWFFHPVLDAGTAAIIASLRAAGNRVVCGTNTNDSHYRTHCERGDYALFDQTYASCLMGVSKPDPAFWQIIMTAEAVAAESCVFIDDRQENCDAAARLGIRAIHFEGAAALAAELGISLPS